MKYHYSLNLLIIFILMLLVGCGPSGSSSDTSGASSSSSSGGSSTSSSSSGGSSTSSSSSGGSSTSSSSSGGSSTSSSSSGGSSTSSSSSGGTTSSLENVTFTINPKPLTAGWIAPGNFELNASASTKASSYEWSVADNAGKEVQTASGVITSIGLQNPGNYTVTLNSADGSGNKGVAKMQITLNANNSQKIAFNINPVPLEAGWVAPGTFELDASATLNAVSYAWSVSDNAGKEIQTASGVKTSIAILNPGIYTVKLTVTKTDGTTEVATKPIPLEQMKISFEITPLSSDGEAPETFFLDATASTKAMTYDWSVADSAGKEMQTASGVKTSIALKNAGNYTVTLTLTDAAGNKGTANKQIVLNSPNPSQKILFNISPIPANAELVAPGNFELDATSTPNGFSYDWSIADSSGKEIQTASGIKTSIALQTAGTYTITLTVTDTAGSKGIASKQITLNAATQQVKFNISGVLQAPGTFGLDASETTPKAASYAWSISDSTSKEIAVASGMKTSVALLKQGTYKIKLVVTNANGTKGESAQQITLNQASPTILSFTVKQIADSYNLEVDASATKSATNRTIVSYSWDVQDSKGKAVLTQVTGVKANLNLSAAGFYGIVLKVTDNTGETFNSTQYYNVTEIPNNPLRAFITVKSPTSRAGSIPLSVLLDGSGSVPATGSTISSFEWVATDKDGKEVAGTKLIGEQVTMIFTNAGEYTITLKVTDKNKGTATTNEIITAEAADPNQGSNIQFTVKKQASKDYPNRVLLDAAKSTVPITQQISSYEWAITKLDDSAVEGFPLKKAVPWASTDSLKDQDLPYIVTLTVIAIDNDNKEYKYPSSKLVKNWDY